MTLPGVVVDGGSLAQRVRGLLPAGSVSWTTGQVVSVDGTGVVVNVGGTQLSGLPLPGVPLQAGDNVVLLQQGGSYLVAGLISTSGLPTSGTVASVPSNSSTIIVSTFLGSIACGWVGAYTPTVGDSVWIVWLGSSPVVFGKQGVTGSPAAPAPPPPKSPPPPPPPRITTGTTTFVAVDSGTYRSSDGWVSNSISGGNVMQGDYGWGANSGAWFYGGRPHSTLRGVTVTGAWIWLRRTQGGTYAGQTVHLIRVANDRQPSGALSYDTGHAYDGVSLAVGQGGWFAIPASMAQAVVDAGGSIGVTSSNPYVRLYGTANSGSAGALKISWRRSS